MSKTKAKKVLDYMPIQACNYIEASCVFKDCPFAWEVFSDSDPDCTWGSNNRTMITPDVIIDALENADDCTAVQRKQIKTVLLRLSKFDKWGEPYIDLEN